MQLTEVDIGNALDKSTVRSPQRLLYIDQLESAYFQVSCVYAEAYRIFNSFPGSILPPLPWGYMWARSNDHHCIIRDGQSFESTFHLRLYGPNEHNQINFLFQVDDVTTYSFAHTRRGTAPKRVYPMTDYDYRVPGFDYSRVKYRQHVRGHLIDLQDTIQVGPAEFWSSNDPCNFVPEPPEYEWGLGIRNQKVRSLRLKPGQTAYSQFTLYPDKPMRTNNKTPVPEEGYFTSYTVNGNNYQRLDVINVDWNENMKRNAGEKVLEHASSSLSTCLTASPIVKEYSADLSDRALRYQSREYRTTALGIQTGDIQARFWSAAVFQRYGAADREFERADDKLSAGLTAGKAGKTADAVHNVKRGLFFSEGLAELDTTEKPISPAIGRESVEYIKHNEAHPIMSVEDLDGITDLIKSLSCL